MGQHLVQLPPTLSAARAHQKKMEDPLYRKLTLLFR